MESNPYYVATVITKLGRILLENGAEVHKIEESMFLLCQRYGSKSIDAYVTPSMLIISFNYNGELVHNIKRVQPKQINLAKIDETNDLCRKVCANTMSFEQLDKQLDIIDQRKGHPVSIKLLASVLCGAGFALMFGGNVVDMIATVILCVVIEGLLLFLNKYQFTSILTNLLASAGISFGTGLLTAILPCNNHIVIISTIMLLIPGLAITNAVKDMAAGDLISGLTRATEAIIIATCIAVGSNFLLILGV